VTTAILRPKRRIALGLVGSAAAVALLAACGPAGSGTASGSEDFTILHHQDMASFNGTPKLIDMLGQGVCSAEAEAQPISFELIDQTAVDTNLTLLAGQDALPVLFTAPGSKELIGDFAGAGQLLDIEQALEDEGVLDQLNPAAIDVAKALYGDTLYTIPFEFNIEGFWYNKDIFDANDIDIPTTWDELGDAAGKLQDAGILPFSAAGDQGWPITRLLSGHLFRTLGADALQKVADGEAKLTDPEYVESAQAIADLGAAGYFGEGVTSVSYDAAMAQFLTGQAGIFYMGSWALGNFNDPAQNQIGEDAIGWFPVPTVDGGVG
jgi:raffinose/stachyose/melibiose transport system substrate-binding protein